MRFDLAKFCVIAVAVWLLLINQSATGSPALDLRPGDASDPCVEGALQIRVTIIGVTNVGIMKLELYDQEDGFLRKRARRRWIRDAAQDGPQLMCIDVPRVGEYAVSGYHDIDGNRKLKKAWNFKPREPFGLSNNPDYRNSMPKYEDASFYVGDTGTDITLRLVNPRDLK